MAEIGIRNYLTGKGYKDEDITYNNGNVMLKGKQFYGATPKADGSTYGDMNALNNAYNNYDTRNQLDQLKTRANVPNAESAGLMAQLKERINKPVTQFNYDANSDPQYQAALRQAQQNSQTAGNNAMVAMGSRGIGNSSITSDRVAQIGQREVGRVTDTVLPQLLNQAYQRFQGQQQAEQAQLGNMFNLASAYDNQDNTSYNRQAQALGLTNEFNQQDLNNQFRTDQAAEQKKQGNWNAYLQSVGLTGDLGTGAKEDYSKLGDKTGNLSLQGQQQKNAYDQQQYANQFNEKQTAFDNKMKQAQMAQQAQQFAASQGIQWANLNQRQQEFVTEQAMKMQQLTAQNDPKSLDNQYKQAQINSLNSKITPAAGIDEYDLALVDSMANQQGVDMSKPETIKSFVADLKGKYGWTTEEAKAVEGHLSKGNQSSNSGGYAGGFLPPFNFESIGNNAQGGLDALKSIPGGFEGYGDYLKETLKSMNPKNLFK